MLLTLFMLFVNAFFGLLTVTLGQDVKQNKRLLLTDPDVIGRRLDFLENTVAKMNHTIADLQRENIQLKQAVSTKEGHGSTFIRWGRTNCSGPHTELVYSGYAAGQIYNAGHGGPANTLCLPNNPELLTSAFTFTDSYLRGTEYERNTFASNSDDEDMPCALCRNRVTSSSVMIPARQTCYSGWGKEYGGILASGSTSHSASNYICVDGNPEFIQSGKADDNGHLMYVVTIDCGPLPCPPYESNRKVPCIVCSI